MISIGKECTGCGLCSVACPKDAILMRENEEGFLYPVIEKDRCNECGRCISVCKDVKDQWHHKNGKPTVKACQTKDAKWLIESTAGGFFPTLAQWVLEQNGVVFGTAYNSCMIPVVRKAESEAEILGFNGSKYVQSDLTPALPEIKKELEMGRQVLFSGTPCQVAAVKTFCKEFVGKTLLTMDVVCYGVPSPGLFRAFLDTIERRMSAKVIDYRFRDKHKNGWSHTTIIRMLDEKGKMLQFEEEDYSKIPYYRMFGSRNCFRRECYNCYYNTTERIADFTTGNFWGIETMTNEFDTRNGVSMVLLNTDFAGIIFEKISDRFQIVDMTLDQAVRANDALVHTCKYPKERDAIYTCYARQGFDTMFPKYYVDTPVQKIKRKSKVLLKKIIKHKK